MALGQVAVPAGGHEITARPALVQAPALALDGCTVTRDAIGCQTAVARTIRAQGADDVLAVKDNPPWLAQDSAECFTDAQALAFAAVAPSTHRSVDSEHGRPELRRVWATGDPEALAVVCRSDAAVDRPA